MIFLVHVSKDYLLVEARILWGAMKNRSCMSFFFGRRQSRGRKVISIMNDLLLVGETFFGAEKSKGAQGKSIMNDILLCRASDGIKPIKSIGSK